MGLEKHDSIQKIKDFQFVRNKTSHDSFFNENIADLEICFGHIKEFKALFICSKTGEPLSERYVSKDKITTKSALLSYTWK